MLIKQRKHIIWLFTIYFLLTQSIFSSLAFAQDSGTSRIAGVDRYQTAVAISQKGWQASDYAVLARGDDFADALCAGPLAQNYSGPILLTEPQSLNADTLTELKRLGVKHLFIAGGTGAIAQSVEDELKAGGIASIERIYGETRHDTSVKIAEKLGNPEKAVLVTGHDFPDALSISVVAAKLGLPILLTSKNDLPAEVSNYFQDHSTITQTYIVGGTGVISADLESQVPNPVRLAGNDRYDTNIAVLEYFGSSFNFETIYVAIGGGGNGDEFADALTGATLAAKTSSPLVLISGSLPKRTGDYLKTKLSFSSNVIALGGQAVVSSAVLAEIIACKGQTPVSQEYNAAGTYGPETGTETINGNVTISAADVTLRNTIIEGDLLLAQSIGDGNVYLKDVTVKGKTLINGGGPNSIIMYNFNGVTVTVDVPEGSNVRLVAQGDTNIANVIMESNGQLQESNLTGTGFVNIIIPANVQVNLAGTFNEVNVQGSGANVTVNSGTISTMTISETANGAEISLANGTTVTNLNADASANITGQGQISRANVSANNVIIAQTPTKTTVAEGITASVGGKTQTGTKPPSSGGGSGSSSGGGGNTVSVTAIAVNPTIMALVVGGAPGTISATVTPINATNKNIIWTSSNEAVATVANGIVTPVAAGTSTITATSAADSNKTATCTLTVNAGVPVTSIVLTGAGDAITTDRGTLQMSATVEPSNATNKTITWSVINGTGSAIISATGLVTAGTNGTVTIRATAKDGSAVFGEKEIAISGQVEQLPAISFVTGPEVKFELNENLWEAVVEFTANQGGTAYYLVVDKDTILTQNAQELKEIVGGEGTPDYVLTRGKHGFEVEPAGNRFDFNYKQNTFADKDYNLYIVLEEIKGAFSEVKQVSFHTPLDTIPPEFNQQGTPTGVFDKRSRAFIITQSVIDYDEFYDLYIWIVAKDMAPVELPTAETVKSSGKKYAMQHSGYAKGDTITYTGLTPATAYVVYLVAQDYSKAGLGGGGLFSDVLLLEETTRADENGPNWAGTSDADCYTIDIAAKTLTIQFDGDIYVENIDTLKTQISIYPGQGDSVPLAAGDNVVINGDTMTITFAQLPSDGFYLYIAKEAIAYQENHASKNKGELSLQVLFSEVDLTAIDTALAAATAAKAGVLISADGTDVETTHKWVSQEVNNTLDSAILTATAAKSTVTTDQEVAAAVAALEEAVGIYNTAKKAGTKVVFAAKTRELPALAYDPDKERYLVAYKRGDVGHTIAETGIYGRFVLPDGDFSGEEFVIAPSATIGTFSPTAVSYDTIKKRFLLVWDDCRDNATDGQWNLYGQFVNSEGVRSGEIFPVSDITDGKEQTDPGIAFDSTQGNFLIIYNHEVGGADDQQGDLHCRLLKADGTLGEDQLIAGGKWGQGGTSVDFNGTDYLVAYGDNGNKVKLINSSGTPSSDAIFFTTAGDGVAVPQLAYNTQLEQFLAVWSARYGVGSSSTWIDDICGSIVLKEGSSANPFVIADQTKLKQFYPDVAAVGDKFAVVWMDAGDSSCDIRAAIVSADQAVSAPIVIANNVGDYASPTVCGGKDGALAAYEVQIGDDSNTKDIQVKKIGLDSSSIIPIESIIITGTGDATTIVSNQTLQMSAAVTPANATEQTVTWSVASGPGTISADGLLTPTGIGVITVKATAQDGSDIEGTKEITVEANSGFFTFVSATGTITNYDKAGGLDVVIPSMIDGVTVTSIGYRAFSAKGLTSVTIPDSVKTIEYNAFTNNQLISIVIGDQVTSIGEYAFNENRLTTVTIPSSVITIGNGAFYGNELTSITIGPDVAFDSILVLSGANMNNFRDVYEAGGAGHYIGTQEGTWTKES